MHRAVIIISLAFLVKYKKVTPLPPKLEKIIIMDAIAWAIKYLIAVSVERGVNLMIKRGIKLIKLISSPIQQVNHELAEQAITVPAISVVKKAT
jgi:hypothetical protein